MNINRNNYEEFFLLYADKELCAEEKKMVDDFVAENPDLAEELAMLQQSILQPDFTALADKESLYRHIVEDETTEKLLLMLDGELKPADKKRLLETTQSDEAVKKEWALLQQTKLPQEQIIFEDKSALYRKEEGRVVAIKWWRMAAAAVLISFGIWGAVSYVNNGNKQGTVVDNNNPTVKPSNTLPTTNEATPSIKEQQNIEQQSTATVEDKKETTPVAPIVKEKAVRQEPLIIKEQKDIVQQGNKNEIKKLPEPSLEIINNGERNKQDVVIVPTIEEKLKEEVILQPTKLTEVTETNKNEVALVNHIDMDNPALSADEDDDKRGRGKLAGFFKKVKRSIARKANIGGDGDRDLKIANMSFAVKAP